MELIPTLNLLALATAGLFFYGIAIVIHRLYFHPLSKFPGPKLAAMTGWYEFYHDIVNDGRFFWKIDEMHKKYGPIVRVNPNELHINDPDYFDEIYASASKKRDKYDRWVISGGAPLSAFSTVTHDEHRVRRAALNPFFAKRSISNIEPLIRQKVDHLCSRFERAASEGAGLRLDTAFMALTMDIITTYVYGRCYHHLDEEDFNLEWKKAIYSSFQSAALIRQFPWLLTGLTNLPRPVVSWLMPPMGLLLGWKKTVRDLVSAIFEGREKKAEDVGKTIFHELLDSPILPPHEKTLDRLCDEGQVLVGAGSETTAKVLAETVFFVLHNPDVLLKLKNELKIAMPSPSTELSWSDLEKLPYLSSTIMEGLRVAGGIPTRLPRLARNEVLKYKEWEIPAGTPISETPFFVLMNPAIFPEPKTFRPERWIEAAERGERLDKYMVTFNKGSRNCLGLNLAYAELFMTVATIFRRFDMELFETTMMDVEIKRDHFVGAPDKFSRGIRVNVATSASL